MLNYKNYLLQEFTPGPMCNGFHVSLEGKRFGVIENINCENKFGWGTHIWSEFSEDPIYIGHSPSIEEAIKNMEIAYKNRGNSNVRDLEEYRRFKAVREMGTPS